MRSNTHRSVLSSIEATRARRIGIITDGEIRRESYSNGFATALERIDLDNPATVRGRIGTVVVPRIVGPIRRLHPVEIRALNGAGADVVHLDEPQLQTRAEEALRLAVPAIDKALDGIPGPTVLHLCFGYAYVAPHKPNRDAFPPELTASTVEQISIEGARPNLYLATLDGLDNKTVIFGVISTGDPRDAGDRRRRIRPMLAHLPPERLVPAPDCGVKIEGIG